MASITQMDPLAPTRAVNEAAQTAATIASWAIVAGVLVFAARKARKDGSWLSLSVVLAVAVGVVNEPLFDKLYHLYFYDAGKQWTWLSTYGFPQPNWTMSAYIIIYALPALLVAERLRAGVDRAWVFKYFVAMSLFVGAFEYTAITLGTYEYFGGHPFQPGKYPLWCAVMEGAHVTVFSILTAVLWPAMKRGWRVLWAFPVFLVSFCSVMFGAGLPGLAVVNADPIPTAVKYLGAIASMGLAAVLVWGVSLLVVREGAGVPSVASFLRGLADRLSPAPSGLRTDPRADVAEEPQVPTLT